MQYSIVNVETNEYESGLYSLDDIRERASAECVPGRVYTIVATSSRFGMDDQAWEYGTVVVDANHKVKITATNGAFP